MACTVKNVAIDALNEIYTFKEHAGVPYYIHHGYGFA